MINILIIGLLCSYNPFVQEGHTWDEEILCLQINGAIEHVKNSGFHGKYRIDSIIRPGWNYESFLSEYLAEKLDVNIDEIWDQKKSKLSVFTKKLENRSYYDTLTIVPNCVFTRIKRSKWTAIISKFDKESLLIHFTYRKNEKTHSYGFINLFFFNSENEIENSYEITWME